MKKSLSAPGLPLPTIHRIEEAVRSLSTHGTQIQDHRNQKFTRFQVGSLDLVAKEYQITGPTRKIPALLGHSRARRSFRAGFQLLKAGIHTPQPVLLIEQGSPVYSQSILVTKFCPGLTLHQILEAGQTPPDSFATDIHHILSNLLHSSIRHGDFHSLNLLICPDTPVSLIDLDSARKRFFNRRITSNIISVRDRLLHSVKAFPDFQKNLMHALGKPGSPFPPS